MSGCFGLPTPLIKVNPPLPTTKKVTVTIEANGFSSTMTSSYPVKDNTSPTVKVLWNGYGFSTQSDGRKLFQQSYNNAFKSGNTAEFRITKIGNVSGPSGSGTTSTSQTVTVRRGVKATF